MEYGIRQAIVGTEWSGSCFWSERYLESFQSAAKGKREEKKEKKELK